MTSVITGRKPRQVIGKRGFLALGVLLLAATTLWQFGFAPRWTARLPRGWGWRSKRVGIATPLRTSFAIRSLAFQVVGFGLILTLAGILQYRSIRDDVYGEVENAGRSAAESIKEMLSEQLQMFTPQGSSRSCCGSIISSPTSSASASSIITHRSSPIPTPRRSAPKRPVVACDACRMRLQARAEGHPYGLVLLARNLPDPDGFKVAEQIRLTSAPDETKIILLAGTELRNEAALCKQLFVSAYLVKPIAESYLLNAINTALACSATGQSDSAQVTCDLANESSADFSPWLAEERFIN